MSNATMPADEALAAYGYARDGDGLWTRSRQRSGPSQSWCQSDSGWLRFDPPTGPIGSPDGGNPRTAAPWGIPVDDPPGVVQVPWKPLPHWANVSGLHPATHPECFEWDWPDDVVAEIYEFAPTVAGESNAYVRQDDGSLVKVA